MLSPLKIETATLAAWPALETVTDEHWQARFAKGFTKRANSIQSMDPDDDGDAANRLDLLANAYSERRLPPVFRVTPLTGRKTLAALEGGGWQAFDPSLVFTMRIDRTQGFDGGSTLYAPTDPAFLAAQTALNAFNATETDAFTDIVSRLAVPASGIVIAADDGTPAASLLCALVNDIAVFLSVVTVPTLRGQGFGRRMMATGLSWAAENGARHAALQVLGTNTPAIALYLGMGFNYRYPYHYRRKPKDLAQ